ncbi:MAG: prevent-host-death protein [Spirochaetia bacterium]|nr:prevent-host-death protein [Spirochaetia bacterium]
MKTMPLGEIKTHFSRVMKEVEAGAEIGVSFGKKKETIAVIVPILEYRKVKARQLGTLKGKMKARFSKDFKITDEEFLQA